MSAELAFSAGEESIRSRFEQLRLGKDIIRSEASVLLALAEQLNDDFCAVAELIFYCRGNVIISGMGKAGLIGQKIAATLGSTGTSSHFVHPSEALHGDLGRIHRFDCCLLLSFSGETEEVNRLLPILTEMEIPTIAMTKSTTSTLGKRADHTIMLGEMDEACPLGLAPSSSTTAMLAMGDALALVVSRMRGFQHGDFAQFHPGGSLGRKFSRVAEWMRPLTHCRVALNELTVRDVLVETSMPGRRTGAIMLIDRCGRLTGIFTDSDLARLLEQRQDEILNSSIAAVMTAAPTTIQEGVLLSEAIETLKATRISELPIVDDEGRPVGLLDITDVLHLIQSQTKEEAKTKEEANAKEDPKQDVQVGLYQPPRDSIEVEKTNPN